MADTPEAKQEAYVAKRIEELQDLGMENDSDSLDTILSELTNRDPRIREAAVDAAVQFGSRDAIPKLEDAAAQTEDAKEKAAILDAIEFLKLPTLTEAIGQKTQTSPDASNGKNP
jgi:HEAT repeat protein